MRPPPTAEELASIKILARDDHGVLWGIPYEMRKDIGQAPGNLIRGYNRAYEAYYSGRDRTGWAMRAEHVPRPKDPREDWVYLGLDVVNDPIVKAWLAQRECVPTSFYEWWDLARENETVSPEQAL